MSAPVPAWRFHAGAAPEATRETLVDEQPVALEVNGIAHAVMLATPADLDDFALGFSLSEGLIDSVADLLDVEEGDGCDGTVLKLTVSARCEARFRSRRRSLSGRTGCGLCGVESLGQLQLSAVPPVVSAAAFDAAALAHAVAALAEHQPLQRATGAAHAAAWCRADGLPQIVREDVGRHNALDKLAGALARAGVDAGQGFIAVTSRASVEMVHKAARTGAPLLAAVSAPTRRAVQLADELQLTLAGFVRGDRATVYSHAGRLKSTPAG